MAIVGDIAFNHDITSYGEKTSLGGAAFYSGIGAARFSEGVGVVARVGKDLDLKQLTRRGLDITGISVADHEKTCQFILRQYPNNTRDFTAVRGAAGVVDTTSFPDLYLQAKYIHLPTQLPQHAITWLEVLRNHGGVSVDSFEAFVMQTPELTVEMFKRADLIFTNQVEYELLKQYGLIMDEKPMILKRGKEGAIYKYKEELVFIPAPKQIARDTTGAGDVLAGAFLSLRAQGCSVATALETAVNIASTSVSEFGVDHIPSLELTQQTPQNVAAMVVINEQGKIFLGRSAKMGNRLIIPGGHIETGETPQQAVQREIKEELGIEVKNIRFLRKHIVEVPEYKEKGARFRCFNFVGTISGARLFLNKEYSEYLLTAPEAALELPDLHHTARLAINYYLQSIVPNRSALSS